MRTENQDPILLKLQEKEAAMAKAIADAKELELQINHLKKTLEMIKPTAYEEYLRSQSSQSSEIAIDPRVAKQQPDDSDVSTSDRKNNPKGVLKSAVVAVLLDGNVRDIDQVYAEANAVLGTPTTRDSVRSTLSALKISGTISSPAYGKYTIKKGESPTDVVATNDNGGALNVQLSPLTGRQ